MCFMFWYLAWFSYDTCIWFKYTLCAEEFYFQTILVNSMFKNDIKNDTLRYIDWKFRNGSNPAFLDKTDFDKIKKSNVFFARKFDYKISEDLLKTISNDY